MGLTLWALRSPLPGLTTELGAQCKIKMCSPYSKSSKTFKTAREQSIKPSVGPSRAWGLCDNTGYTPMKLALPVTIPSLESYLGNYWKNEWITMGKKTGYWENFIDNPSK